MKILSVTVNDSGQWINIHFSDGGEIIVHINDLIKTESMDDKEKTRRGDLLAGILNVPYIRREARYRTEWGSKTALGLYETAKRIIKEGK